MLLYHSLCLFLLFSFLLAHKNYMVWIKSQVVFEKRRMILDKFAHTPGEANLGLLCLQQLIFFQQTFDANQNNLVEHEKIMSHLAVRFYNLSKVFLCQKAQDAYLRDFEQFGIRLTEWHEK